MKGRAAEILVPLTVLAAFLGLWEYAAAAGWPTEAAQPRPITATNRAVIRLRNTS